MRHFHPQASFLCTGKRLMRRLPCTRPPLVDFPKAPPSLSWGVIQYSPENYPENCPEKCPELCNCSNSYFLNFLAVIFEGFFGTFFGTIFGILFGTVLNCTPGSPSPSRGTRGATWRRYSGDTSSFPISVRFTQNQAEASC